MIESKIQKRIMLLCKERDILAVKVDSTSSRGWPDLTLVLPNGVVLFAELKTETGVLSALQKRMIKKIKANKGKAHVIRNEKEFTDIINRELANE